jgi:starch-binding outer membrane protein, SusD/RagB family
MSIIAVMKRQFLQYTIFKIAMLLMIFGVSLTSCNDFLDQTPTDGLVLEEYWKNKEEVLSTLGGAYQLFSELDYRLFVQGELRGDMLQPNGTRTGGSERAVMSANIETNQWFARWDDFYETINICNHVIKLAPGVQDPTFTDYLKQQYVSEATFLRSLTYFYLVRVWQDVPFITEPTTTDEGEFFPGVTSGEVILDSIKADLIEIRNRMPEHPTIEQSKSRATAGAVNALLADISLWNFEYDDCITYIEAVENSGQYFLLPATEWFQNFNPGFSLENIFEIYFDQTRGQANNFANRAYSTTDAGIYYFGSEYAQEILSVETTEAGELIRGNGSLSTDHQIWKYAGAIPDKTTLRPGNLNRSANFIIYRLADLYLMKAEAYSQKASPDFPKALEYLNAIRERSNMATYSQFTSAQAFEDAILLERAKELAFEGKRWFDLLRMGRRNDYARKADLIEILIQNVPSTQKLVLKSRLSDPNGWYMPIHISEIDRNKNLTQNSYYDEN